MKESHEKNLFDSEISNFAHAVKSVCDHTKIKSKELCHIINCHFITDYVMNGAYIKHKETIPYKYAVSNDLVPMADHDYSPKNEYRLSVCPKPSPGIDRYSRHLYGLNEFIFYEPKVSSEPVLKRDNIKFWRFNDEKDFQSLSWVYFIEKKNLKKFYKYSLTIKQRGKKIDPPILPKGMLQEIYDNSIGFLLGGRDSKSLYEEYNIPFKRGLLLCGKPGSGKTLTLKWLKYLCQKHDFAYKIVTMPQYERTRQNGDIKEIFTLHKNKPGIIFFDDMDVMVQSRASGKSGDLQTFLTNLDGINGNEGVVYIFTTNFVKELDGAFVRPGRIDLFLTFKEPSKSLRTRFIKEKFNTKMLEVIDLEKMIEKTNDRTFAEIEEIRKLIALELIKNKKIDVDNIFNLFEKHRKDFEAREEFGFNKLSEDDSELGEDPFYPSECEPEQDF